MMKHLIISKSKMEIRFFILFLYIMSFVHYGYAQIRKEYNPLSEQWIGWSVGKNQKNFDFKIPVQEQVGGIQITTDNSTVRTGTSSRTTKSKNRKTNISPKAVNERIDAWRAEMKAREEARRRQIEEENRRDRERGFKDYYARTAKYHQDNASRDAWKATEGVQYLKENYHAEDMANPPKNEVEPQMDVMSGKDMANMLRNNSGLTIIYEREQNRVRSFDKKLDQITVTTNIEIDNDQAKKYAEAYKQLGVISLSKQKTKAKEPVVLINHHELLIDSLDIFALPKYGLVAVWEDSLIVFKDHNLGKIAWLDMGIYSKVVPCGNKLIGKCKSSLYIVGEQTATFLLDFDTSNYYVYAHDEKSVYLLFRYMGLSTIIKVDIESKTYTEIVKIPQSIWSIASNGKVMFALIENAIFTIDDNDGVLQKIFETDECINDIVFSSEGLLIATDNRILRVKSAQSVEVFYDKGVKRLWFDGKNVYAQNETDDLLLFK